MPISMVPEYVEVTDYYAFYKGRKYMLQYIGNTKFGWRARLRFTNGWKEFWVDADKLVKCHQPVSDDDMWEYVGENKPTIYDCFDSHSDFDPDVGDR